MKRLLFLLLLVLICISSKAQTFEFNYLGRDFDLYKGVLLKMSEGNVSDFTYTFYGDLKYCQKPYDNHVLYPERKYKFKTNEEALANRVFRVNKIIEKNGTELLNYSIEPIFVLQDTLTGEIVYFKYDIKYEHNFPFNSSPINLDADIISKKITRKVDDFTDEVKFNSPLLSSMVIIKNISKNDTLFFLRLQAHGKVATVKGTGVIVLFSDGSKWENPVKIKVDVDKNDYKYTAFMQLTPEDVEIFSTKKISKFRLCIFDREVSSIDSDKFIAYVNCMIQAK